MVTTALNIIIPLLAVLAVSFAAWKWHIIRDRRLIISVVRNSLSTRTSLWIGILAGVVYLAVFMVLGGQGGRIHIMFGRVIWNTTAIEVLAGILLSVLVLLAMSLFVFGAGILGAKESGKKSGIGLAGSMLAVIAAFCP